MMAQPRYINPVGLRVGHAVVSADFFFAWGVDSVHYWRYNQGTNLKNLKGDSIHV